MKLIVETKKRAHAIHLLRNDFVKRMEWISERSEELYGKRPYWVYEHFNVGDMEDTTMFSILYFVLPFWGLFSGRNRQVGKSNKRKFRQSLYFMFLREGR